MPHGTITRKLTGFQMDTLFLNYNHVKFYKAIDYSNREIYDKSKIYTYELNIRFGDGSTASKLFADMYEEAFLQKYKK